MSSEYRFITNLIAASHSKTLEEAMKEWEIVKYENRKDYNGTQCICNHRIKRIVYLFNMFTKKIITSGRGCVKKFASKIEQKHKGHRMIREICSLFINSGQYLKIEDIDKYTSDCAQALKIKIIQELNEAPTISDIAKLKADVSELVFHYKIDYLKEILLTIDQKIILMKEREKQYEAEQERVAALEKAEQERVAALEKAEQERVAALEKAEQERVAENVRLAEQRLTEWRISEKKRKEELYIVTQKHLNELRTKSPINRSVDSGSSSIKLVNRDIREYLKPRPI
jgi:hypothetical protein